MSTLLTSTLTTNPSATTTSSLPSTPASNSTYSYSESKKDKIEDVFIYGWPVIIGVTWLFGCAIVICCTYAMVAVGSPGRSKLVAFLLLIISPIWAIPYFGWKLCGAKFVKWIAGLWKSIARVVVRLGDRTKFAEREREAGVRVGDGIGQVGSRKVDLGSGNGGGGGLPKRGVSVELEVIT